MEADEEKSGSINLKRQRAPLSDSEDNVFSSSEVNDVQKRRRLEASGQENRSPKPSSSGRFAELEAKPDTPMVPSIRSRVQQLTQRQDVAPVAQRCLSDPGADSPSHYQEKGFREHLLGEGEFNQRMERFKAPLFQASPAPTPSPINPCPRTCSNFVSDIQQKLQCTTTPSSHQASRIREERKQELLRLQPISENAWLKRSSSDPSLTQADGDAEMKDGSFTETLTSGARKQSLDETSERAPCDSETPAASVGQRRSNEGQLQMEWKEQNPHQGEEVRVEEDLKASVGNEEKQLGCQQSETQSQTVLKLSFSEDQCFSRAPVAEIQNVSEFPLRGEQSILETNNPDESNVEVAGEVSKVADQGVSGVFSPEEIDRYSYTEEEIEPSTDEESRLWRYPKDDESILAEDEEDVYSESSRVEKGSVADGFEPSDLQDAECCVSNASSETAAGSSDMQEEKKPEAETDKLESESRLDSVKEQNADKGKVESCKGRREGAITGDINTLTMKQGQEDADGRIHNYDMCQESREILTVGTQEYLNLESGSRVTETEEAPFQDISQPEYTRLETNIMSDTRHEAESSDTDFSDGTQCLMEVQVSDQLLESEEMEEDEVAEGQGVVEELSQTTDRGESSKKVTFILEPKLINDSILSETSMESKAESCMSDAELSSHDETNTAEIIDQMFEEVLEYAGRMGEERAHNDEDTEGHDSGIGVCSGDKDKMDTESEKEKSEEEAEAKEEECDESKAIEGNADELLSFPPSGILSPLSKSVEAVVTPLQRLAATQESNPPSLLLTPEEASKPPAESVPLYSVDAYRTQRQNKQPAIQSVTPGLQRRAPQKSQPKPSVNTKEKITALNEEAGKLQTVISQTLQALSCCTDEDHGRGSLEEAEAEKLLLVSCEKRSALLAEVTRLREERNSESGEAEGDDKDYVSQQPCRGTVGITNIQLPLKVEFVCSSHNRSGRPSHYFFILIRYGPCNIVATPLATAADAQKGDTISFPTSVTLKDIRSSFEIDVEVYSLSHTSTSNCNMDRTTTKSRVTPRKLLNTITRSSNTMTSALPALNTRRSSNFSLVGSHKITLASLGHSKFPLDKMKLEGKIRRLLGDEFQEKVPFLSPLEGNIYLRLDSESHSNVQHQGFLTMFELISGYGVWHRRYFVLEGCNMYYWNHPNDREAKAAEGSISLSGSTSQSVRPVKRDSCARPFTFELVSNVQPQQDNSEEATAKCWFSADTKQERLDWMEKFNQALLDFHTWNRTSVTQSESQQSNMSSSGNLRESIL